MNNFKEYIIEKLKINKDTKINSHLVFDTFIYSLFNIKENNKIYNILSNWKNNKKSDILINALYSKTLNDFQKTLDDNDINNIKIYITNLKCIDEKLKNFFVDYPDLTRNLVYNDKHIQIYLSSKAIYITNGKSTENYLEVNRVLLEKL